MTDSTPIHSASASEATEAVHAAEGAGDTESTENLDHEWMPFPGGELLGQRPSASCAACRDRVRDGAGWGAPQRTICFQCYRANLERRRRLLASVEAVSASEARFQLTQPFEPIDRDRLERLRLARTTARVAAATGLSRFERRRRQAQIAARHALEAGAGPEGPHQRLFADDAHAATDAHDADGTNDTTRVVRAVAVGGEELRMPMAWLPFLMSR